MEQLSTIQFAGPGVDDASDDVRRVETFHIVTYVTGADVDDATDDGGRAELYHNNCDVHHSS